MPQVEVQGIREVLGGKDRHSILHIGAVKPNIGHSEGASGIISLIKVLLMMKHGKITPQAHFRTLNPSIGALEPDKMAICTLPQDWDDDSRLALVNSYGASGNNAAAVVAPPPLRPTPTGPIIALKDGDTWPIFVSAATQASLQSYCASLKAQTEDKSASAGRLADIAFALATKQNRLLQHVFAATVSSGKRPMSSVRLHVIHADSVPFSIIVTELRTRLLAPDTHITEPKAKPLVLLFSGQNGNTTPPVRDLYDRSLLFRTHLHRCDDVTRGLGFACIFPAVLDGVKGDADLILRHAAMFAVRYSSGMGWIDSGVKPMAVCGQSFGEYAALTVSGALTLEAGVRLITGYVPSKIVRSCFAQ
jgi:acyl transferase domain-containing protein